VSAIAPSPFALGADGPPFGNQQLGVVRRQIDEVADAAA
jgi:hypothetical protein